MKKTGIIVVSLVLIALVCAIYTWISVKKYPDYDYERLTFAECPCDYGAVVSDCGGSRFIIKLRGKKVFMEPYGIQLEDCLQNKQWTYMHFDYQKLFKYPQLLYAELTDTEYCLIRDYEKYVLAPLWSPESMRFYGRRNHPVYSVCFDSDDYKTTVGVHGNDPRVVFFVLMLALPLYIRHVFPVVLLLWLLFFGIVRLTLKNYFKGSSLSRIEKIRLINKKCDIPLRYAVYSCAFIAAVQFLLSAPALAQFNDYMIWREKLIFFKKYYTMLGINVFGGLLFAASQLYILASLVKKDRIRYFFAYGFPTGILFCLQWQLFYKCLGAGTEYFSAQANFVRSVIGINEGVPLYPKIVVFTLFFMIGVPIYFVFGFLISKNLRKNLAQSTAFAAVNAFMCCSAVYIINFGHSLIYNTSFFY